MKKETDAFKAKLTEMIQESDPDDFLDRSFNPTVQDETEWERQKRTLVKKIEKDGFYEALAEDGEEILDALVIALIESL